MKIRKLFSLLYIIALVALILFIAREYFNISDTTADVFYYIAIGIFGIGIIRVLFLVGNKNK